MVQQGQVFQLTRCGPDGEQLWAYRYRTGGRDSKRVQRGGFASEQDARDALERELERLRREARIARRLTLGELVETYLAQHDVQPVTIEKLRYLLSKATAVFGERRIGELTSQEIAEWRMTLSPGYRFEATQALRQVLAPSRRVGDDRRQSGEGRRRQPDAAPEGAASVRVVGGARSARRCNRPAVRADDPVRGRDRAAAGGWIALEKRDIDRDERVVYVRRSFTRGELKHPKTEASLRAVPLQARALDALDRIETATARRCSFPASEAATSTSITSAPTNGGPHRRPSASTRFGGSTISGTPSRPSRSVPASPPSTSPATWAPA